MNAGLSGKVTMICAPAGFGKTTLLVEWVQAIARPTAWLSLDDNDNELRVFVHALAAALQSVFPDAFQAAASLLKASQFPSLEQVATLFINDLADVPEDVILVLDDYHLIHTSEVHTLLELFIRYLPSQLHLVLATRFDPPLPLAKWLARGYLNEMRAADLRFTLQETQAFLALALGKEVAHETAMALEERTEGWIAMVRLAALSLRTTADTPSFVRRLRHFPDRDMSIYLVEEVLEQQTPAVQELLVRASMLEQFCAGLCTAILGSDASKAQVQSTLDWLERSNFFLVPLDERQGWYRFHTLFRGLLERRLQAHRGTEELAALHRRASAWYAEQGLVDGALQHALAAGDVSNAVQLVEAQLLWVFEQEQWVQMERWLRLLPEAQIQGSPTLLFAKAWIAQAHEEYKDFPRLLAAAEQLLRTGDSGVRDQDDTQYRTLRALIALAWCDFQYTTGQAQACLESAQSALRWIAPGEAFIACHALFFLALSNQAFGQEDIALDVLNQALREPSATLSYTARLLFAQAGVYLMAGKLRQVEPPARYLLRIAQEANLALSQYWAHWLLGYVHYEWNDLDEAVYHFSVVVANQHRSHFWPLQLAMCGLVLAYHAQGLGARAQEAARALLELVQQEHNMRMLMPVYAFQGQMALMQDEVEEASPWVELAGEQEVRGPRMSFEDPPLTTAWMLLAKGDEQSVAHGQALLADLLQVVAALHETRKTIQVLALQALAYDRQGRLIKALEVLEHALALASVGGYIRTFADVPQLAKLLQEVRKHRKARKTIDPRMDAYLQRILAAMTPQAAQPVSTEELIQREGLEPLTEREMQVLSSLARDLTNKEIARELVVTPGTVKVHTNNLYRKLSVNNRRSAVTLSKALGPLSAD